MRKYPASRKFVYLVYRVMFPKSERWLTVHGVPMLVNIHDFGIGTQLFLQKGYAQARVDEIKKIVKEGDTVIDIGANIGYFTVLLAKIVGSKGRVFAFEPDPRNAKLLQRTIQRNGWSNVFLEQKAVSSKSGKIILYQTHSWAGNALTPCEAVSKVEVEVVGIDSIIHEFNVGFVKMDMDGSEPLAIIGMKNLIRRSPNLRILAEYQPDNLRRYLSEPLDFITIANKNGLVLEAILDSDSGRLPTLDLLPLQNLEGDKNLDLLFVRKKD
jgi:FkbM family methyltransferase